jgi:hypothetical protein
MVLPVPCPIAVALLKPYQPRHKTGVHGGVPYIANSFPKGVS